MPVTSLSRGGVVRRGAHRSHQVADARVRSIGDALGALAGESALLLVDQAIEHALICTTTSSTAVGPRVAARRAAKGRSWVAEGCRAPNLPTISARLGRSSGSSRRVWVIAASYLPLSRDWIRPWRCRTVPRVEPIMPKLPLSLTPLFLFFVSCGASQSPSHRLVANPASGHRRAAGCRVGRRVRPARSHAPRARAAVGRTHRERQDAEPVYRPPTCARSRRPRTTTSFAEARSPASALITRRASPSALRSVFRPVKRPSGCRTSRCTSEMETPSP